MGCKSSIMGLSGKGAVFRKWKPFSLINYDDRPQNASVTWNEWGAQSICICETNPWGKSPKEKFQRNPRGKMKKEE